MNDYDEVVHSLRQIISGTRYVNFRQATTGKLNADGSLNPNATDGLPDGYIWLRFGEDRSAAVVKNMTMRNVAGVHVEVVYDLYHQEDQVWEVDRVRALEAMGAAAAAAMNVPEQGAGISTPVSARDVVPGGVFADVDGGLNVRLAPTWTPFGAWWDGTTLIALTPTATANSKSFVVIGIQDNGTVTTALTADRGLAAPLVTSDGLPTAGGAADIQAVTESDPAVWWVGAVELANGDTSVNPAKIVDRRFWNLPGNAGDGGAGGAAPQAYIVGLEVDCASTTQITIQPGLCRDDADGYTMIRATADGVLTVDITSSGANGLDTGSESSNTWYYVWLIAKSSDGTLAGLLSTSATAPTLPSGYDKQRCVGVVRNNASSNLLRGRTMRGGGNMRYWLYHESTIVSPFRVLSAANLALTTWTDVDTSAVVPPLSRLAVVTFLLSTPSSSAAIAWREKGVTTHEVNILSALSTDESVNTTAVPVDSSQIGQIYSYTNVTEDAYADVIAYWYSVTPAFAGSSGADPSELFYQTIEGNEVAVTQRGKLNFADSATGGIDLTVTDESGDDRSTVTAALNLAGMTEDSAYTAASDFIPYQKTGTGVRLIKPSALFASPPAIGGTAAAAISATTLNTSGDVVVGAAGANTARLNVNGAASGIAAILRANATSPSDLVQMQDSTGFILSKFTSTGGLGLGVPNPQHFFQCNNAFATGTGTISSSGTSVTGSGTIFNTELVIGATIYANGQARRVTSVGTNTAAVIDSAFSPNLSAGTTFIYNRPIFVMDQSTGNAGMSVAPVSDVNLYLYGNLRVGGTGGGVVYIRTTTHSIYYNNPDMIYLINQASGAHRFKSNGIDRLYIYNGGAVTVYPQSASGVGLEVAGYSAAQSGNLVDFKTSAGASLGSVAANGAATHAPRDAVTNTITPALTIGHNTSGTPAAGYGVSLVVKLENPSFEDVEVGRDVWLWHTEIDASRKPDRVFYLRDAGGEREIWRQRADGSVGAFSFFGATPQAQSTGWAVTNPSTRKTFDTTTVTVSELAEVVGTMIAFLIARGDFAA